MADTNDVIGGYKLRNLLQTGQQSQVFECVEPRSGRHFAMKILLPEFATNSAVRGTLFHEASVGIKMRHENVINIVSVSESKTTPHFIMEFFPSGSLRTRLMSRDPKDKEFVKAHARKIFKQMAVGLSYMNNSGYVHRDVKPDNVLVNALGQLKIIDFAITKKMKAGFLAKLMHRGKKPQGTRSYMSPEQIKDELLDGRADIYSYGATLYELTTGRPPFRAASQNELITKHLREQPTSPVNYNADLTDEFGKFVLRMLAKKRDDRPANFNEVLMELRKTRIFKSVQEDLDAEAN